MKTVLTAVLVAVIASACSHRPLLGNLLHHWVGRPEAKLIEVWGMPDKVTTSPTGKTVEYVDCAPKGAFSHPRPKIPKCPESEQHKWRFDVRGGIVTGARYDEMGAEEALVKK